MIGSGSNSWLEGYLSWISDAGGGSVASPFYATACCRLDANGDFIDTSGELL